MGRGDGTGLISGPMLRPLTNSAHRPTEYTNSLSQTAELTVILAYSLQNMELTFK